MLPNGKGKQRSTKNGTAKEIQQWCLALLSNGEIDLKSHADSVRKSTYAGQEMRVINIPADNCEFACFLSIFTGKANGALFADLLDKAVRENHGTAFNAWLDHLTINYDTIKEGLARF
ncbi:Superfamily II helicase and inactivated derivatives [Kluyvera cryocrescens]|uniref:Superfamily II helicase and inactivated derivatives n=1 Tax=Kluyvera cryocrescens TaxID=580 RepID=A0A485AYF6_KLUCR|nr:Superfamily II helicase and inactivated derivatives [Kluyvera cryocrescens]